jgi:uncharacterized SAM-binding protein YcdF (DUF218 family)
LRQYLISKFTEKGNNYSRAYASRAGVSEEDILLEEQSTITQENIFYGVEIMNENGINTAILVSDPLHMKRAMLMAKDYGLEAYSSPTPTKTSHNNALI